MIQGSVSRRVAANEAQDADAPMNNLRAVVRWTMGLKLAGELKV